MLKKESKINDKNRKSQSRMIQSETKLKNPIIDQIKSIECFCNKFFSEMEKTRTNNIIKIIMYFLKKYLNDWKN